MTNNKKNFLKALLTTASAFAIVTNISTSTMAAVKVTGGNESLSAVGTWGGDAAPINNDSIQLGGNHALNADAADRIISAYDINGKNAGVITVNANLSLGSVGNVNGGSAADIIFGSASVLTLTGTAGGAVGANDYSGIANIDFAGNAGTLYAGNLIDGNVDSTVGINGTLVLTKDGAGITGAIGVANPLTEVIFNAGGAITLGGDARAADFTFSKADTVTADGTITGDVDFADNAGTLNVAGLIDGNVDSTDGSNGTLSLTADKAGVTGTIGATNPLTEVMFSAAGGTITLGGNASAADFTYDAADTVTAGGTITGDVDFAGNAGILNAAGLINGNVDSTDGAGGTLNLTAAGSGVTGVIGATNPLAEVTASGAGNITLDDTINTAILNIKQGATVKAADNSAAAIAAINIGEAGGGSTLVIDTKNGDYDLPGNAITFHHADSLLKLTHIDKGAAHKVITLTKNLAPGAGVDLQGNLEINATGGNLTIAGATTIGTDKTHRLQNFTISGNKAITITPQVFAKTITISSTADVTFAVAALQPSNPLLHFTAGTKVITDGYDLNDTNLTHVAGVNDSIFEVNADQAISGNIGMSAADPFGTIHVAATSVLDRDVSISTAHFFAGITGSKAKVIFNHPGSSVSSLGEAGTQVKNVDFVTNGRVRGPVYASTIDVRAGQVATFDNVTLEGARMKMHAADAQANFTARVVSNMPIQANAGGDGVINFNSGVVLNKDIGAEGARVAAVNIGNDSTINANIHANNIAIGGHELTLNKDAVFDGVTDFTDTTIKLAEHNLTMQGGNVTFTGLSKIETTTTAAGNAGKLVAGAGTKVEMAGGANIEVEVTEVGVIPTGATIVLIKKDGGTVNLDNARVRVINAGAFSQWYNTVTDDGLILTHNLQVKAKTNAIAAKMGNKDIVTEEFAAALEEAMPGTPGFEVLEQLSLIADDEKLNEAQARIAKNNSETIVNMQKLKEITNMVSDRMASSTAIVTGVAAGDDDLDRFGMWVTPFFSKDTQKKHKSTSRFKADSYGATLGIDTKPNDDMTIGMALSAMNTYIKYRDVKPHDKTRISSYLISVYGQQQITNSWFTQAVLSGGFSNAHNKKYRRISNTQLAIAESKSTSMDFAADIFVGCKRLVGNSFTVTPMIGLNYDRINGSSYDEYGTAGPQLMEVSRKASQKLDIVGGIKLTSTPFVLRDVAITPKAHAFVRHDVSGKGVRVKTKIQGLDLPSETAKLQRTFYNVGASLNADRGATEYGIFMDANFADKYVGIQGSIKLRVNF